MNINMPIWVISYNQMKTHLNQIIIEIFEGRNKFTQKGLYSGPLRKFILSHHSQDKAVLFFLNLHIANIQKNKFFIDRSDFLKFITYMNDIHAESLYIRLSDRKLHHVSLINYSTEVTTAPFLYTQKNLSLLLYSSSMEKNNSTQIITSPQPILYLEIRREKIFCRVCFRYGMIEIPSNSQEIKIYIDKNIVSRNLLKEQTYISFIKEQGGVPSFNNEYIFSLNNINNSSISAFIQNSFQIYLKDDKCFHQIKSVNITANISYDIDWFNLDGIVTIDSTNYTLSDILSRDKYKGFIEVGNSAIILPPSLNNLSNKVSDNGKIHLANNELMLVNNIAEELNIKDRNYIKKFKKYIFKTVYEIDGLNGVLKDYQLYGVSWIYSLYNHSLGCCLADDMGLGKTIQAIAFITYIYPKLSLPILIIVPKIVLLNWKNEFSKFSPRIVPFIIYGNHTYEIKKAPVVYITTYETIVLHTSLFKALTYEAIILDESQYVKNDKTRRYKAIKQLSTNFILALSGTPIENNLFELWALMDLLNPHLLGSKKTFTTNYINNEKNFSVLKATISPFMLRRTKEKVLQFLPKKTEKFIHCNMGESQRKLYNYILILAKNELLSKGSRFKIKDNAAILQAFLYLREACSEPQLLPLSLRHSTSCESCKYDLFKLYTPNIIKEHKKLIVFCQFPKILKKLKRWCDSNHWSTFYIDGNTNNRERIISLFEQSKEGIFFISLKAGGVGLNLTSAQFVIIYEPWWNPSAERQASDRIYRIGQDKPVFIYHFIVNDTIEEKIIELQDKKKKIYSDFIAADVSNKFKLDDIITIILEHGN